MVLNVHFCDGKKHREEALLYKSHHSNVNQNTQFLNSKVVIMEIKLAKQHMVSACTATVENRELHISSNKKTCFCLNTNMLSIVSIPGHPQKTLLSSTSSIRTVPVLNRLRFSATQFWIRSSLWIKEGFPKVIKGLQLGKGEGWETLVNAESLDRWGHLWAASVITVPLKETWKSGRFPTGQGGQFNYI